MLTRPLSTTVYTTYKVSQRILSQILFKVNKKTDGIDQDQTAHHVQADLVYAVRKTNGLRPWRQAG